MLCGPHRYNNGHVDIFIGFSLPSAVQKSERVCVHSLPTVLKRCDTGISWAVEGLPVLLHLSLFLFFGGLAVFLFNVNREVFGYVAWWIVLFSLAYGMVALTPIIWHDSPYHSPLSTPAWMLCTGMACLTFKILAFITYRPRQGRDATWKRYRNSGNHYYDWMLGGVEKAAEEMVSKRLPTIDGQILGWTITTLGNDDSLEKFFEAIPGFLTSNQVKGPEAKSLDEIGRKLSDALHGFWDRTSSSNSASDSDKIRRLDISLKAMSLVRVSDTSSILQNILFKRWDKVPQTLEMGQSLAYWCTADNEATAYYAQSIIARILASVQKRDDNWVSLAARAFGLPEHDLRNNITGGGDSMLLAIFNHVAGKSRPLHYSVWMVLEELSKFDIRNTLPRLQHNFCMLWNEIVQEARKQGRNSTPVSILKRIRHLYHALHQGTPAAPTKFTASTNYFNPILSDPSSYPLCKITSHRLLPRLRARGLGNIGNVSFANAVLQLLANLPPSWNLFRELRDLKGQRGAGVPDTTGGGATPLVDATLRFLKEIIVEEKSPSTQQQSSSTQQQSSSTQQQSPSAQQQLPSTQQQSPSMQQQSSSTQQQLPSTQQQSHSTQQQSQQAMRADGEKKDVDSFEPMYMYDAMKGKRQLKPLLVRSRAYAVASCY